MLLDEAREQYEQLLKNSSNKSLQKRNTFLERNLEQLTRVHQQLVNQNNELRLEKKVSEKKLAARNERIRGLEVLLASAQEKLQQQSEKYAPIFSPSSPSLVRLPFVYLIQPRQPDLQVQAAGG